VESPGGGAGRQPPSLTVPPVGEVSTERLSVFEDFLGKLDMDRLDKDAPPSQDNPEGEDDDTGGGPETDKPDKPKRPRKK
jgi:hypothetical protein